MKNNKIVGLILLIAGVALIAFGGYQSFLLVSKDKAPNDKESEQEKYDKMFNVERNKSEKLNEEKCLEKICFNNMKVFKEDGVFYATAEITNKGTETIENKYVNVIFVGKDGFSKKQTQVIIKLEGKKMQPFESQFTDNGNAMIKDVTDYSLEFASQEDIEKVNIVNE